MWIKQNSRGISYLDVVVATAIISIAIVPLTALIKNYNSLIEKEEQLYNLSSFADEVMQTVVSKGYKERFSASTAIGKEANEDGLDWRSLDDVDDYDSLEITISEYIGLKCSVFVSYASVPAASGAISGAGRFNCTEFKEIHACINSADPLSSAGRLYDIKTIRAFGESVDEDEVITEALFFDGNNDYAEFSASSQFSSGNDEFQILLSIWLEEPSDTTQEKILIDNPGLYHITLQNNRLWFKTKNTDPEAMVQQQLSNSLQYNRWNRLELYKTLTDLGSNIYGSCGYMGEYHKGGFSITMKDTLQGDKKLYLGGSPNFSGQSVEGYIRDFSFFRYPVYWFPPGDSTKNLKDEIVKSNHFDESQRFEPENLIFTPQAPTAKPGYFQNNYEPRKENNLVLGGAGEVLTVAKLDTTPMPDAVKIIKNNFNYSISIVSGTNSTNLGTFNKPANFKEVQARVLDISDTTTSNYRKCLMLFGLTDSQGSQGKYVKYYWTSTPDPENYATNIQQAVLQDPDHRFKGVVKIADLTGETDDILYLTDQGIVADIEDFGNGIVRAPNQALSTDMLIVPNQYITDFTIGDGNGDGKNDILFLQSMGSKPTLNWAINPGFTVDTVTNQGRFVSDFITDCVNCRIDDIASVDYHFAALKGNNDHYSDIIIVPRRANNYSNELPLYYYSSGGSQDSDFAAPNHFVITNATIPQEFNIQGISLPVLIPSPADVLAGQSFTAENNANLTKIKAEIWSSASPYLNLREWVSDDPDRALTGDILAVSNLGTGLAGSGAPGILNTFNFPTSPRLELGKKYVFEILQFEQVYADTTGTYRGGTAYSFFNLPVAPFAYSIMDNADLRFEVWVTLGGPDLQVQAYQKQFIATMDSILPQNYVRTLTLDNGDTMDVKVSHFDEKIFEPYIFDANNDTLDDVLITYSYGREKWDRNWTSDSTWTYSASDTALQKGFVIENISGSLVDANTGLMNTSAWSGGYPEFETEVFVAGEQNEVANGDFEQGNTGFTSDYRYRTNLGPHGAYWVGNLDLTPGVHSAFRGSDHTSGSGKFMVVNGADNQGVNVWRQSISVLPNANYDFSIWVCTVVPYSPAILQFSINGQTLGAPFIAPNQRNLWVKFFESWNSGSSTTADIAIVNQNTHWAGNDFGLDDIMFTTEYNKKLKTYYISQNNSDYIKVGNTYKREEEDETVRYVTDFDPPFMIASFKLNNETDKGNKIIGSSNASSFNEFVFRGAAINYQGAEWKKLPEFPRILLVEEE